MDIRDLDKVKTTDLPAVIREHMGDAYPFYSVKAFQPNRFSKEVENFLVYRTPVLSRKGIELHIRINGGQGISTIEAPASFDDDRVIMYTNQNEAVQTVFGHIEGPVEQFIERLHRVIRRREGKINKDHQQPSERVDIEDINERNQYAVGIAQQAAEILEEGGPLRLNHTKYRSAITVRRGIDIEVMTDRVDRCYMEYCLNTRGSREDLLESHQFFMDRGFDVDQFYYSKGSLSLTIKMYLDEYREDLFELTRECRMYGRMIANEIKGD